MEIVERDAGCLDDYAQIPSRFTVGSRLVPELIDGGYGGITLREEPVDPQWVKDYEALPDGGARSYAREFDTSSWGFLMALDGGSTVGGGVIAHGTPEPNGLTPGDDVAALWDIRIHPAYRRRGIGRALVERVCDWASTRGCVRLDVETQNVNVRACRFYRAVGFQLGRIDRFGYWFEPEVRYEVMLVWSRGLQSGRR